MPVDQFDASGPINVLVTAAGRRTSLVRAFVEAAHTRGGRVYGADVDGLAPALYLADEAVRTLASGDQAYLDDLLETVRRLGIGLLVPTIDTDLPILAAGRARFESAGCIVAVSSGSFVQMTMDKWLTVARFGEAGIRVPRSWIPPLHDAADLPDDLFVKPRQGSASKDIHLIERSAVDRILTFIDRPIVQEVLTGPEITIDALLDFQGRPLHFVPRTRIKTVGGESVQGVTLEHDDELEGWIEQVLEVCGSLGATGPLTVQAFLTPNGPVLSEVNPRFGGGFPLALAAGGAYPAWLLDLAQGLPVASRLRDYETGLYMTRYNVEHFVRRPLW